MEDGKQQDIPESVGTQLKRQRKERGLSIQEVAEETKVSTLNLRALEEDNYRALPADAFVRGLLAMYAEYLGINSDDIIAQFFMERDGSSFSGIKRGHTTAKNMPQPKDMAEPAHVPSARIAGLLLFLLALIFTGYCYYASWNPFSFITDKINFKKNAEIPAVIMEPKEGAQQKQTGDDLVQKQQPQEILNENKATAAHNQKIELIKESPLPAEVLQAKPDIPALIEQPPEPEQSSVPVPTLETEKAEAETGTEAEVDETQTETSPNPEETKLIPEQELPLPAVDTNVPENSEQQPTTEDQKISEEQKEQDTQGEQTEPSTPVAAPENLESPDPEQVLEKKPFVAVRPTTRKKQLGNTAMVNSLDTTYELQATFTENTWVEVTIDGEKRERRFFLNGDRNAWKGFRSLQLTFGQPDSAVLLLNDDTVLFPRDSGNNTTILSIPGDIPSE